MTTTYRIALIPGDGIGREVVPEGVKVLEKIADRFDIAFTWDEFDWSCERFDRCGAMMPPNMSRLVERLLIIQKIPAQGMRTSAQAGRRK